MIDAVEAHHDWEDARHNARTALRELRESADRAALAEAEYYRAKAIATENMQAKGVAATVISLKVKGVEPVASRLYEFRLSSGLLTAAKLASQLYNNEEAHTYDLYKRCMSGDSDRY